MSSQSKALFSMSDQFPEADESIDVELGKRLKALRVQSGKTQADIAAVLGVSPQQYQKYEKGSSKCSLESLVRLAAHYKQPVASLLPDSLGAKSGMSESEDAFVAPGAAVADEAHLIAEVTALFIRIGSKETRRKLIALLSEISQ